MLCLHWDEGDEAYREDFARLASDDGGVVAAEREGKRKGEEEKQKIVGQT